MAHNRKSSADQAQNSLVNEAKDLLVQFKSEVDPTDGTPNQDDTVIEVMLQEAIENNNVDAALIKEAKTVLETLQKINGTFDKKFRHS